MAIVRAVLLNDTRVDAHHGCDAVIEALFQLGGDAGLTINKTAPAHRDWRADQGFLDALDQCDVVIVNGEGTLHHDAPWGEPLLAAGAYAASRGKKAVLINASWQANGEAYAAMARTFDLVSVREEASAAILRAQGVACRVVPDLALLHDIPGADERHGVVYSDSTIAAAGLALARHMNGRRGAVPISIFNRTPTLLETFRLIRRVAPRYAILRPSRFNEAYQLGRRDAAARQSDGQAWKTALGRQRLAVTGRFHLLAFCLASRTPFLAVSSNTHKIEALVADAGLPGWRVTRTELIDNGLLDRAGSWEPGELSAIEAYLERGRAGMRQLFADIAALAP